jgi:hypothetical protein
MNRISAKQKSRFSNNSPAKETEMDWEKLSLPSPVHLSTHPFFLLNNEYK